MKRLLMIMMIMVAVSVAAETFTLRATKYHPGRGGAGWVTASGARIDNDKLKRYEIRWVALSHDMFRQYGFRLGDSINVRCERFPVLNGVWIVKDKMGPRLRKKIDFLLPYRDTTGFNTPTNVEIEKL